MCIPIVLFADIHKNKTPKVTIEPKNVKHIRNYDGFIIKYKQDVKTQNTLSALKKDKNTLSVKILNVNKKIILLKSKKTINEMKDIFKKDPKIESFQLNYKRSRSEITPDDTYFGELWGLHNEAQSGGTVDCDMDAPEAWDKSTGSKSVVVAILDTGVDYQHSDLMHNMWVNQVEIDGTEGIDDDNNGYIDDIYGYDFASNNEGENDSDPIDIQGHGTHIAGTIGAQGDNGNGVVGINWNVSIMALKVERPDGGFYDSDIFEALDYINIMKDKGVNIVAINASYGGLGGEQTDSMNEEIKALSSKGILFCAAAGNSSTNNDSATAEYPATYNADNIIAVAATDKDDMLATFSGYGATTVDIGAPGVEIYSTAPKSHTPSSNDIFFDDMEGDASQWTTGGTKNTWALSTDQELAENPSYPVPSPTHFWSDSSGVDYSSNTDSYLEVKDPIDLSGYEGTNLYFAFWSALQIQQTHDHGYVEISKDGGDNWTSIVDYSGYDWWWEKFSYLIPEEYKTSNFKFRFHMTTDGSVEQNGWMIDNVGIGTSADDSYVYMDGTSMATPQVVGAVALMASVHASESALQRKSRILNNVDEVSSLEGKVLSGGRLNLEKSINAQTNNFTSILTYLLF